MQNNQFSSKEINPLGSLDEWEDDLLERDPDPEKLPPQKPLNHTGTMKNLHVTQSVNFTS